MGPWEQCSLMVMWLENSHWRRPSPLGSTGSLFLQISVLGHSSVCAVDLRGLWYQDESRAWVRLCIPLKPRTPTCQQRLTLTLSVAPSLEETNLAPDGSCSNRDKSSFHEVLLLKSFVEGSLMNGTSCRARGDLSSAKDTLCQLLHILMSPLSTFYLSYCCGDGFCTNIF